MRRARRSRCPLRYPPSSTRLLPPTSRSPCRRCWSHHCRSTRRAAMSRPDRCAMRCSTTRPPRTPTSFEACPPTPALLDLVPVSVAAGAIDGELRARILPALREVPFLASSASVEPGESTAEPEIRMRPSNAVHAGRRRAGVRRLTRRGARTGTARPGAGVVGASKSDGAGGAWEFGGCRSARLSTTWRPSSENRRGGIALQRRSPMPGCRPTCSPGCLFRWARAASRVRREGC